MSTYDPGPDIAEGGTPITDARPEEVLATDAVDEPLTSSGRSSGGAFAADSVSDGDSAAAPATPPAGESQLDAAAAAGPLTWSVRAEDEDPPPLGGDGVS